MVLEGLNELIYVKWLDQYLIHNKYYIFSDINVILCQLVYRENHSLSSFILVQEDMNKLSLLLKYLCIYCNPALKKCLKYASLVI